MIPKIRRLQKYSTAALKSVIQPFPANTANFQMARLLPVGPLLSRAMSWCAFEWSYQRKRAAASDEKTKRKSNSQKKKSN